MCERELDSTLSQILRKPLPNCIHLAIVLHLGYLATVFGPCSAHLVIPPMLNILLIPVLEMRVVEFVPFQCLESNILPSPLKLAYCLHKS